MGSYLGPLNEAMGNITLRYGDTYEHLASSENFGRAEQSNFTDNHARVNNGHHENSKIHQNIQIFRPPESKHSPLTVMDDISCIP